LTLTHSAWRQLAAAGDQRAVMSATAAAFYIEHEKEPELNSFLVNLCARSGMGRGAAEEPEAERPD